MISDILAFVRHLSRRTRVALVLYIVGALLISTLDLLGVAVILPLIQVLMSEGHYTGYLATLHGLFGNPGDQAFIVILGVVLIAAFVGKAIAALTIKWFSTRYLMRKEVELSAAIMYKYQLEPYEVHKTRSFPEVMRDVNAATGDAFNKVLSGSLSFLSEGCTVLFITIMLLVLYPGVTLAAVAYFGVIAFVMQRSLASQNERIGQEVLDWSYQLQRTIVRAVYGFREVKLYGQERPANRDFQKSRLGIADAGRRGNYFGEVPKYLLEVVFVIGLCLIIMLFALTNPAAQVISAIAVFGAACIRILPSIVRLVATAGIIRSGRAGLTRMNDLLDETTELYGPEGYQGLLRRVDEELPEDGGRSHPKAAHASDLVVDDVHFQYQDASQEVVKGVSFTVPAGTSLALCGGSGAGKTTVVDIMLGLMKPTAGSVTYGDLQVKDSYEEWFRKISYVPQDVFLLDDTLSANIAFGIPAEEVDEERIQDVIRRVDLQDLVAGLDHGLDTLVGERGTRLSGGQRQRVGIARALYTDPEIIFFDEATSALDNETERKITETVNKLAGEVTTVIVAHRLSTVRHVDHLLFMEDGRISAEGTFEEVQAQSPQFAELVRLGRLE